MGAGVPTTEECVKRELEVFVLECEAVRSRVDENKGGSSRPLPSTWLAAIGEIPEKEFEEVDLRCLKCMLGRRFPEDEDGKNAAVVDASRSLKKPEVA